MGEEWLWASKAWALPSSSGSAVRSALRQHTPEGRIVSNDCHHNLCDDCNMIFNTLFSLKFIISHRYIKYDDMTCSLWYDVIIMCSRLMCAWFCCLPDSEQSELWTYLYTIQQDPVHLDLGLERSSPSLPTPPEYLYNCSRKAMDLLVFCTRAGMDTHGPFWAHCNVGTYSSLSLYHFYYSYHPSPCYPLCFQGWFW